MGALDGHTTFGDSDGIRDPGKCRSFEEKEKEDAYEGEGWEIPSSLRYLSWDLALARES